MNLLYLLSHSCIHILIKFSIYFGFESVNRGINVEYVGALAPAGRGGSDRRSGRRPQMFGGTLSKGGGLHPIPRSADGSDGKNG